MCRPASPPPSLQLALSTHTLKIMWLMGATWLEIARTCRASPIPLPVQARSQSQSPFKSANFRQSLTDCTCRLRFVVFVYLIVARDSLIKRQWRGEVVGGAPRAVAFACQLSLNVIFKPVVSAHMGHKKGLASCAYTPPPSLSHPSPLLFSLCLFICALCAQKHLVFIVKLVGRRRVY